MKFLKFFAIALIFSSQYAQAASVTVTTTVDQNNSSTECSLREAILVINAGSNASHTECTIDESENSIGTNDTILLANDTVYVVDYNGAINENNAEKGDLDLLNAVTITTTDSTGIPATIESQMTANRIFEIRTNGDVTLSNLIISNASLQTTVNTSLRMGAVLLSSATYSGNVTLENISIQDANVVFDETVDNGTREFKGGLIFIAGPTSTDPTTFPEVSFSNVTFQNNTVSASDTTPSDELHGVLFYTEYTNVTLQNLAFSNNSMQTVNNFYGALAFVNSSPVTITDFAFSADNSSTNTCESANTNIYGCAFYFYDSDFEITRATVSGIQSYASQGANYGASMIEDSNGVVTNSTFSNNTIESLYIAIAGGFYFNTTTAYLNFVTITDNQVTSTNSQAVGGGLAVNLSNIFLKSTLIADNNLSGFAAVQGPNCYTSTSGTTLTSLNHNIIDDISSCTITDWQSGDYNDVEATDYDVANISDNGGFTKTVETESDDPGVDIGDCLIYDIDGNTSTLSTDQTGEDRDAECDAGAYEFVTSSSNNTGGDSGSGNNSGSGSGSGNSDNLCTADVETCDDTPNENESPTSSGGCQLNPHHASATPFILIFSLGLLLIMLRRKQV